MLAKGSTLNPATSNLMERKLNITLQCSNSEFRQVPINYLLLNEPVWVDLNPILLQAKAKLSGNCLHPTFKKPDELSYMSPTLIFSILYNN